MVDINLMGEDDSSEDRQREESFAKTVNLDEPDTTADEGSTSSFSREPMATSFSRESMGSSFAKKPPELYGEGSSRTKAYLIVVGIILAALTAVYFLIPKSPKQPASTTLSGQTEVQPLEGDLGEDLGEPELAAETNLPPAETQTQPSDLGEEPASTAPMNLATNLSPFERDLVASTRLGAQTVNALANSFSAPNDFTLITYHGNNRFFVEFLSSSSDVTATLTDEIQRNVSPVELKTVSQSSLNLGGRTLNKVLVAGTMDAQAGLAGITGSISRMNIAEFSDWIKGLGDSYGLVLKRYETGTRSASDDTDSVPVQVHFSGSHSGIEQFLSAFADANPSASISKIIVSPSNRRTLSTDQLDLVMHFGFVELF